MIDNLPLDLVRVVLLGRPFLSQHLHDTRWSDLTFGLRMAPEIRHQLCSRLPTGLSPLSPVAKPVVILRPSSASATTESSGTSIQLDRHVRVPRYGSVQVRVRYTPPAALRQASPSLANVAELFEPGEPIQALGVSMPYALIASDSGYITLHIDNPHPFRVACPVGLTLGSITIVQITQQTDDFVVDCGAVRYPNNTYGR